MAARKSSNARKALPFEAWIADPANPRRQRLIPWNIPDDADYGEACRTGEEWAVAWLAHDDTFLRLGLGMLVPEMIEREARLPPGSLSTGFRVGFLSVLTRLAHEGATRWGGAEYFLAEVRKQADEREAAVAEEERARRSEASRRGHETRRRRVTR